MDAMVDVCNIAVPEAGHGGKDDDRLFEDP